LVIFEKKNFLLIFTITCKIDLEFLESIFHQLFSLIFFLAKKWNILLAVLPRSNNRSTYWVTYHSHTLSLSFSLSFFLSHSLSLSLSLTTFLYLSFSITHTHTYTKNPVHVRSHAHTHSHTYALKTIVMFSSFAFTGTS